MLRGERPVLELSTRLGVYHTDASENDAMRALRGILPWAEAGHRDVASEQLGEELVGVRREELGAVVSPEALDAGLAVDLGEVLSALSVRKDCMHFVNSSEVWLRTKYRSRHRVASSRKAIHPM